MKHFALLTLATVGALAVLGRAAIAEAPNTLTAAERAERWRLLFDGTTLDGWRGYKKPDAAGTRWRVADGALCIPHDDGSDTLGQRDIVSSDEFDTFDLNFEWKVGPGSNSGLKYFVTENRDAAIGHEYQIIDDERHEDAKVAGGERQTASFYDVKAASSHPTRPIGEWNHSRVARHRQPRRALAQRREGAGIRAWKPRVAAAVEDSKFKGMAGFGTRVKGHILLQDHGEAVCFRSVKIKPLEQSIRSDRVGSGPIGSDQVRVGSRSYCGQSGSGSGRIGSDQVGSRPTRVT